MRKKFLFLALALAAAFSTDATTALNFSKANADDGQRIAKVWLIGGQSNAHGVTYSADITQPDMGTVKYYDSHSNLIVPMRMGFGMDASRFGPEVGIAEILAQKMPNEEHFIIKYAWGNTDLYQDWRSPSAGGSKGIQYTAFVGAVKKGIMKLQNEGYKTEICGMAWVQGENDCIYEYKANEYAQNLYCLLHDFYAEFKCEFPVVLSGEIEESYYRPYHQKVVRAKRAVAEAMDGVVYMSISDINVMASDPWHYDGPSMLKAGQKFGTLLAKLNGY